MVSALMLEGPSRGKTITTPRDHLKVAIYHEMPFTIGLSLDPVGSEPFSAKTYRAVKCVFFDVMVTVWVPDGVGNIEEQNRWAIYHLLDPSLHSGFAQCAEVPQSWADKPPTYKAESTRVQEIDR